MTAPPSLDDDLVYMLRHSHLSANSLRDLEREIADREILKNARLQHQRVHDAAVCASRNYELEEETRRLEEIAKQERRRVKLAELRIKEQAEVDRLKAVPTPTPPPPPPPPQAQQPQKETTRSIATQTPPLQPQDAAAIPPPPTTKPPVQPSPPASQPPPPAFPSQPAPPKTPTSLFPQKSAFSQPPLQQQAPSWPVQSTQQPISSPHIHPDADRYVQIHQELKKLRKHVLDLSSQRDPNDPERDPNKKRRTPESQAFRDIVGDLRRELRAKVGMIKSIKGVPGANKEQITAIMDIMRRALEYKSPTYDPSPFFVRVPPPVQGQPDQLPLVFLYIMHLFAKTIINQFISEAGTKPEAADPIGTVAVNIIARPVHFWRGVPLVDMMIAKLRVTCPVLFGFRGNEKTEAGRERLGWWKSNGTWVPEQTHNDRMTGLGAGYAAISLRDFSRVTSMTNPYPPTKYWTSMAAILSTPAAEVSNTQYVVLKAMIEGYEMRFLTFYGSAARAALKIAVVDFPARAPEQNASVTSLSFLGGKIQDELGLRLG